MIYKIFVFFGLRLKVVIEFFNEFDFEKLIFLREYLNIVKYLIYKQKGQKKVFYVYLLCDFVFIEFE